MRRTRKTARAFFAALILALALSACAPRTADTPGPRESVGAEVSENAQAQAPRTDVENNGGHYVRVGETVYFRRCGEHALSKTATFGEFTDVWNANGGESELMAYTPATGELAPLFTENGTGAIWYGDGGFYLHEFLADYDYVIWYAQDGGSSQTIHMGRPLGVTESGMLALEYREGAPDYRTVYAFYRDKTLVGEARVPNDNFFSYAGLSDAGVFLVQADYGEGTELNCRLIQLTPEGKTLELGALPEVEDESYYDVQVDRFLAAGDRVAVGVGYYMGTGHFLGDAVFMQADVGQEGSARALDVTLEEEAWELPRLVADEDGTFSTVDTLPGELSVEYETGDLRLFEDGAWRVAAERFCPPMTDGSGYRRIVQDMDYVDGTAYVTLACAFASPVDDIGWRDAYSLLDMLYLAVETDAAPKELDCVDHHAELYGEVWFLKDGSEALWRQYPSDGSDDYIPASAYLIPVAEDADWIGGREAAWDGLSGRLPDDFGENGASYYGYDLPDAEPAGWLCLTLDRDGRITSLANKAPDALLSIAFDVSDAARAGAAETLAIERRESDEDTAWFWTKLCALEDDVRVRVERTPDECEDMAEFALEEGTFVAGEVLYDGTLKRGEFLALRASLPWHPELRVSVCKDGAWGAYVFGEDNYLHLETEEALHPELTLAAYPAADTDELTDGGVLAALTGTWLYRTPPLAYTATVRIDPDGSVFIADEEHFWQLRASMEHLYAESWQTPDLLCLSTSDEEAAERIGFGGAVGDYLVELFRTDGKEILHLTQANNGDGALSYLLPECDGQYDFTLTRDVGFGEENSLRRGETFCAEVVRYDRARYCLWLQEAQTVDEYPGGGEVRRARPNAPCLPYPISGKDAILSLRACRDPEFPMYICDVTVGGDGVIQLIG